MKIDTLIKAEGYATAIAGKWHVSLIHKHNTINAFGFDQYQVWQIFDKEGNKRRRYWAPHMNRNGTLITDQVKDRYGPDVDVEFLLDFITTNAEEKQPFWTTLPLACLIPVGTDPRYGRSALPEAT